MYREASMERTHLSRHELGQYSFLVEQKQLLQTQIAEIELELEELCKYEMRISPVYSGLPSGNEFRDKMADFIIKMEENRNRLQTKHSMLIAESSTIEYSLHQILVSIRQVPHLQVREILTWHYIEGKSIIEYADTHYISPNAIYKKLGRYFSNKKQL